MPDEMLQTTPCPHCGEAVTEAQSVCPHCGAELNASWPPPPAGIEEERVGGTGLTSAGSVGDGFGSGCLVSVPFGLLWFLIAFFLSALEHGDMRQYHRLMGAFAVTAGAWLVLMSALYLHQRPRHPRFARGFGYSLIAVLIVLISTLLFCGV